MARERRLATRTKPTMTVVAEAAGVSVFTVSAVVNRTAFVSPELTERVKEAIRTTGYQPNAVARSLKTGTTKTIGIAVGDITNPFYTDVVAVAQQTLQRNGYAMMLCCSDRSDVQQEDHLALLRDRMVDGLIIAPTGRDEVLRKSLAEVSIPVVLIDRTTDAVECDSVTLDNRTAVLDAMQYLMSLGHRRIGFIAGSLESYTGRERLAGYRIALEGAGIEPEDDLIQHGSYRADDAYNATLRLLTSVERPTAIFSSNNLMLIGVMKALRDLGLRCPDDISIASLDDFPWSDAFEPRLTTVAQPVRIIGEQAANLMLERLDGRYSGPPRRVVLRGELHIRGSCRPPARPA
jgi:LacI family transcriptional regulator